MKQGKQLSAVAAAVMMALASGGVHALGLGVPNTRAILGETLRMSVPLELEQGETRRPVVALAHRVLARGQADAASSTVNGPSRRS